MHISRSSTLGGLHASNIIFLAVLQTQALLFHDQLPVGWGGVGWDNVPVHTQAQRPHHLSCCPADTTTPLLSSCRVELV